jgi:DNA invertase Pin-like site-specific DNA recombinase/DNA-binding winged helix-turn-helix (wHTH) protein
MEPKLPVPAAQYVRMSTEDQQYSIVNQAAAIQLYAQSHGYSVVSTYADEGKSGVAIKDRKGLRRLLSDVMSGRAEFNAILVYDVSRWGRFQDVDEAAHYEFLCRSAGISVRYCAEQFENDGSASSAIMKALKRTMAAEYSRELGVKVLEGQRRIAGLGYRTVGPAGYGMRRMMVSPDGRRRLVLKDGERKAIHTDRTILVPGPKREVACIRKIFGLAAAGKTPREIAEEVNRRRSTLPSSGRFWGRSSIYRILTNEKYAGCNTYGKTTQRLSAVSRVVEPQFWIRHPDAFVPIITREVFDRVHLLLKRRGPPPAKSNAYLLQRMKKALAKDGKLTHRTLKKRSILGFSYYKRFGSIMKAYGIVGYEPPSRTLKLSETQSRIRLLRTELYIRLKQLFSNRVRFVCLPGQNVRQIVEVDGRLRVGIYLCRTIDNMPTGELGWVLRLRPLDRHLPILICTVNQSFSQLQNFYLLAPADSSVRWRTLREGQPWMSAGRKLGKLEDLCAVANEFLPQSNCENYVTVDDILIDADTFTITLDKKEISLGPVTFAIFNMLARNAGKTVSRDRLRRSISEPMDSSNLDARIFTLRSKLGAENRNRIQTVKGTGFMYVSPDKTAESDFKVASRRLHFDVA